MNQRIRYCSIIIAGIVLIYMAGCKGAGQEAYERAMQGQASTSNITDSESQSVKLQWTKVVKLKSNVSKKSKVFKIQGKEWKISWKTTPKKGKEGEFILLLRDKRNKNDAEIIANVTGADEDTRYLNSKGSYYLVINTNQNYEVWVEELK